MRVTLLQMMPQNLRSDKNIKAICNALQPELDKMWKEVDLAAVYKNFDMLPERIIDELAWQFHVDFYDEGLPIETKRKLVKYSIQHHRHKGTPWAVEDMLSTIFKEVWLSEWFEYGGKPYFFRVYTTDSFKNKQHADSFFKALWAIKNTRSWLEALVFIKKHKIYYGMYAQKAKKHTIFPAKPQDKNLDLNVYFGGTVARKKVVRKLRVINIFIEENNKRYEVTGPGGEILDYER